MTFKECQPRDSDECLKTSPNWNSDRTCKNAFADNPEWCITWARDVRRCCPETCGTGSFTEEDCALWTSGEGGDCIYPNHAQCHGNGSMIRRQYFNTIEIIRQ